MSLEKKIIVIDEKKYKLDNLNDSLKATIQLLEFSTERFKELTNTKALLLRAKKSYLKSLKTEILEKKSGLLLED